MFDLRRREFITLLGGAATAWPLAARGQQPAMPVIGLLSSVPFETRRDQVAAFHRGLNESGYSEGQNVTIEYRSADNELDRLPALAAELVNRRVTVIVTIGGDIPIRAAKAATTSFPWSSSPAMTWSQPAWSPASIGRAAISQASTSWSS
jgi:putative tryptophan/tyrosine transport system substrate-binding protein